MRQWLTALGIGKKIAMICCLFFFPIGISLYLIVSGYSENLNAARLEQSGDAYQRPLMLILEQLPQHQKLTNTYLHGSRDVSSQLEGVKRRIDQSMELLREADNRFGAALQFTEEGLAKRKREHYRFETILSEWNTLKGQFATQTPETADKQHTHLIEDLRS